jgi:hypothetical protein
LRAGISEASRIIEHLRGASPLVRIWGHVVAAQRLPVGSRQARQVALLILETANEKERRITMNRQMEVISAAREWTKYFGLPAVVMALWLAAVVVLAIQVASPAPLQTAIEEVLATSVTQTAPVPSPTTQAASQSNLASKPTQRTPGQG